MMLRPAAEAASRRAFLASTGIAPRWGPSSTRYLSTVSSGGGGCPVTGAAAPFVTTGAATTNGEVRLREIPTLPYLGSLVPQYSNIPAIDPTTLYDFYPEVRRRYGDFYKIGMPGLGKGSHGIMYVLTDPNEMQKVLRQERGKHPYPRGIVETEWPLVHWLESNGSIAGAFGGRGETWKRLRSFLQTDLLGPQAAAGYVPNMVEAARLASKGAPASSDDLNTYTNRCSFDLFNSLMFGQLSEVANPESGRDNQENVEFCNATVNGIHLMIQQMMSPLQVILFKFGVSPHMSMYKDMASSLTTAFEIADKKYEEFRKRSQANELAEVEKSSYLGRAIVRQAAEGSNVSEQDLAELIKVSLVAAIDTTSSMLSWNVLHLALNGDVQEKLRAELLESTKKCGGLNAESLRKANSPYLHAVLRETHRLTPAAPVTVMKENSVADLEVHGSVVPKDSLFVLDGYSVGLDMVDEPDEFRPDRWLPDAVEARRGTPAEVLDHPFYRDAFSQGSRKCPATRVANNEVLVLLSQLVLDWRMTPPEGYSKEDVTYKMDGMIHPHLPKLNFEAR